MWIPPLLLRDDDLGALLHDLGCLEARRRNLVSIYALTGDRARAESLRRLLEHLRTDHALAPCMWKSAAARADTLRANGQTRLAELWRESVLRMQAEWEVMDSLLTTLP